MYSKEQEAEAFHRVLRWWQNGMKEKSNTAFTAGLERTMACLVETVIGTSPRPMPSAQEETAEGCANKLYPLPDNPHFQECLYYDPVFLEPIDHLAKERTAFLKGCALMEGKGLKWVKVESEKDLPDGIVLYEIDVNTEHFKTTNYHRLNRDQVLEDLQKGFKLRYLSETGRDEELTALRGQVEMLKDTLHFDQTGLAKALAGIVKLAEGYSWIADGRGPYAWDDDRYKQEVFNILENVKGAAKHGLQLSSAIAHSVCCGREPRTVTIEGIGYMKIQEVTDDDIQEYIKMGKYYGYPDCCIQYFIKKASAGSFENSFEQDAVHKNTGFTPCQDCAERIVKGETTLHELIKDRQHHLPFPRSDEYFEYSIDADAKDLLVTKEEREQWEYAMAGQIAYEKEIENHNNSILAGISGTARPDFINICHDCNVTGKIQILDQPKGINQDEEYGIFTEIYVDQGSVGDSGDSFAGCIYAKFGENKWLKIPYEC